MGKDFRVIIEEPVRRADFMAVFGRKEVCIQSPLPEWAKLAGFDDPVQVYYLDFDEITTEERQRLVELIAQKFGEAPEEVNRLLDVHGLPILASDCFVVINNAQRWLFD